MSAISVFKNILSKVIWFQFGFILCCFSNFLKPSFWKALIQIRSHLQKRQESACSRFSAFGELASAKNFRYFFLIIKEKQFGNIHKLRRQAWREGGLAKCLFYYISLCSKLEWALWDYHSYLLL